MAREFIFRGKKIAELQQMNQNDFVKLIPARQRRSMLRGLTEPQKKLMKKIRKAKEGLLKRPVKTHCRDIIITPEMVGISLHVHRGKGFAIVTILPEMVGHYLGEFAQTRQKVEHSSPGIGATRSSSAVSVK